MAIVALNTLFVQVAASTTGGTAPGGTTAPTGCTLSSPSDISAYVVQISNEVNVATPDATTFGSGSYQAFVAGLKSGKLDLTLLNDYAASALDSLVGINGTKVALGATGVIEVRPSSGARSTSNPGFVASFINKNWQPFNAKVGDLPQVSWSLQITGGFGELTA